MLYIGLDIGTHSIKLVALTATNNSYTIHRVDTFPLNTHSDQDNELELLTSLRALSNDYDPANTKFILGLDNRHVTFRRLTFPFKERHKILKSLPFELEDEIPFSQENATFDAKVSRYVDGSSEVIAITSPNEQIQKIVQLCQDAKIELEILSVNSLAFSNLFENWAAPPPSKSITDNSHDFLSQPANIILNMGHEVTHLLVYQDDYLLETKSFNWGGKNIATDLANQYGVPFNEARKKLESSGFILLDLEGATSAQVDYSNTIKNSLNSFLQNLSLSLIEIKSKYDLNYVKGAITGGLAHIKNIEAHTEKVVNIPIAKVRVLTQENCPNSTLRESYPYTAGVAFGLALESLKKPKNPAINLLKGSFARKSQAFKLFTEKWSYTLALAAAIFVGSIIYGIIRDSSSLELTNYSQQNLRYHAKNIAQLKGSKASGRNVKKYVAQQKKALASQSSLEKLSKLSSPLDILLKIYQTLTPSQFANINIKRFSLQNEFLEIEGITRGPASLQNLRQALNRLSKKGKIKNLPSQAEAPPIGWKNFSIQVPVNRFYEDL